NVFICTPPGGHATEDALTQAYENLLDENTSLFQEKTESLTSYQLNFMRAIISGVHEDFGKADVREEYNLGSHSNIVRIKTALIEKELIETRSDGLFIADPVMKHWLRSRLRLV
ncbi:MAG: ATP-binding protein, partial [Prevotella sp.]|nr:ATP-binding protein [Prevotella sp.]